MNKMQFQLIAEKTLRKECQRKAAYDVMFNGVTAYSAEVTHKCSPNTVRRSINIVTSMYDYCLAVYAAQ